MRLNIPKTVTFESFSSTASSSLSDTAMMQVVVLKVDFHDDKAKKKILKIVSGHSGVVSIAVDSKDMKLTVTGDIDPVSLVSKLRKLCSADIVSVGPPKAPEKKEEPPIVDYSTKIMQAYYEAYKNSLYYPKPHYYHRTVEEDPNACVIC